MFKRSPAFMLGGENRIVNAFEVGGIEYFMFSDAFNTASIRGLNALMVYDELENRVDDIYLKAYVAEMDKILSNQKTISIQKIAVLHQNLKERMSMIIIPELVWKFASVVFFDKTESPYNYDSKYAFEKIKHWKKFKTAEEFFFSLPLKTLIPALGRVQQSLTLPLSSIDQAVKLMDQKHFPNRSTKQYKPIMKVGPSSR